MYFNHWSKGENIENTSEIAFFAFYTRVRVSLLVKQILKRKQCLKICF